MMLNEVCTKLYNRRHGINRLVASLFAMNAWVAAGAGVVTVLSNWGASESVLLWGGTAWLCTAALVLPAALFLPDIRRNALLAIIAKHKVRMMALQRELHSTHIPMSDSTERFAMLLMQRHMVIHRDCSLPTTAPGPGRWPKARE